MRKIILFASASLLIVLATVLVARYGVTLSWMGVDGIAAGMHRREVMNVLTGQGIDEIQPRHLHGSRCGSKQSTEQWTRLDHDKADSMAALSRFDSWTYFGAEQSYRVDVCFNGDVVSSIYWKPIIRE